MEQAGVALIAQGAAAYMADMRSASNATNTFVDQTEKGAGIVGRAGSAMGSAIKGVATIAAGVGVAGFVALGKSIFDGLGDAREAAKLLASTEQTILTMGNAAGRSAEDVVALATALSDASGMSLFGDDQIQQASNLLLTFGNIKGETFDLATALTVDLAQALGGAPADQAMMLGKALNDPIKGITALGKAGLTFSEEQKEVIKAMVESGNIAGAQSIIIEELNRQVGGQAAAAAAADGGWTQLTATLGELQESVGAAVLPMLNILVGMLNESVMPVVTAVADAFGGVISTFADAGAMSSEFGEAVGYLATQLGLPGELIQDIVFAAQDVVAAFMDAGGMSSEFGESIGYLASQLGLPGELVQDIVFAVQDLVDWFGTAGDSSSDLGGAVTDLSAIWTKAQDIVQSVMDAYMNIAQAVLPVIARFVDEHGDEISAFFKTAYDSVIQIVNLALDVYNGIVPPVLNAIAGFIEDHGSEIVKILKGAWDIISSLVTGVLDTIKGIFTTTLAIINGDWEGAWNGIKTIADAQLNAIKGVIEGFLNIIAGIFDTTLDEILTLWENNWNMAVDIATSIDWGAVGSSIVGGIKQGLIDNWNSLTSWISDRVGSMVDEALAAIGAGSPAKEWMPVGEFSVTGIMKGFGDTWPQLAAQVAELGDSLVDQAKDIASSVQDEIANAFGATASIDRQIAKNMEAVSKIDEGFYRTATENALSAAQAQAEMYADPETGAKFFALRSKQILEFQKLQQEINKEENAETKRRLEQQQILILKAQEAEQSAFETSNSRTGGGAQDISDQIRALMDDMDDIKLTDKQGGLLAPLAALGDVLRNMLGQLQATVSTPMQSGGYPAGGSSTTSTTRNYTMPIYTNNTPAALQQSLAIAEAMVP